MKKQVTDGLLQIALLLSILRTDLNLHNYLNLVDNQFTYPEIHDIILGSTSAYTQTSNFHSNQWHDGVSGYSHPKSIDNYYASSVFRELHSLSQYRRFENVPTQLDSYLLTAGEQLLPGSGQNDNSNGISSGSASSGGTLGDSNNNNVQGPSSPEGAAEPAESESHSLPANSAPTLPSFDSELTKEDMDLIDILWRQDMDLGVAREAYDLNMRRQLEKDKEIEMQKQQQLEEFTNLGDLDSDDTKNEQTVPAPSEDDNITYVLDTETGEWEPAAQTEESNKVQTDVQLDETDGLSAEEAFLFLQTQIHQPSVGETEHQNVPTSPPMPLVAPLTQGTPPSIEGELEDELEAVINVAEQMTADLEQQQSQQEEQNTLTIEPVAPVQRQSSFEQNWQDIASLLNLANVNATGSSQQPNLPAMDMGNANVSMLNISDNEMNPLIQNATLVPPSEQSFNLSQPIDIPTIEPQVTMPSNTTMMTSPLEANPIQSLLNDTMPNHSGNGMFGLDADDLMFPNLTAPLVKQEDPDYMLPLNITNQINTSAAAVPSNEGGMLRQLMGAENPVENMEINETSLVEGLHRARMMDDVSSDSAVSSMGSSPNHNDFNETGSMMSNMSSAFDGLEGATGGSDYDSGSDKYSPKLLSNGNFAESGFFRFNSPRGSSGGRRHQSSMSNGSEGFGDFDGFDESGFASMRHIKHNHTYTVPPGEAPKERKSDIKKKEKEAMADRKSLSRDEKKARALKVPFTVAEIINSPVEEFNDMLQKHKLTEPQLQLIRDIRRRGKNKVAAQNCRKRKIDTIVTLEDEVIQLRAEKERLMKERRMIDKQKMELKAGMNNLYKEVFSSLRDENGEPYDPTQYTLEQTSDGNVILIPTNGTAIPTDHREKNSRKRKGGSNKKQK